MNIYLKTSNPGSDYEIKEIENGMTLAQIADKFTIEEKLPYRILLAGLNGRDTELTAAPKEGDKIHLLDMRTRSADLVYQRTLSMVFLLAVQDIEESMGYKKFRGEIDNSLNKGIFVKVVSKTSNEDEITKYSNVELSDELAKKLDSRMRRIIEDDLPIECEVVSKQEGIRRWKKYGYPEKAQLLEEMTESDFLPKFYRIGDFENYFFGPMAPSTGYLGLFELKKYEGGLLLRFPFSSNPNEMPEYRDDHKIYEVFEEESKWLELLGANYIPDINDMIDAGKVRDMVLLSEALHEKKISDIADDISHKRKRIVLISGPSSSGKTSFARRLCVQLRVNGLKPLYMGMDDYFIDRKDSPLDENGEKNYENLEALDINLFSQNINDLLAGKDVDIPAFDFMDGVKKFGSNITKINSDQLIVIEGIHALNAKVTEQIPDKEKYKIYISPFLHIKLDVQNRIPMTDTRLLRRIVRDYNYRGHSASDTIKLWPKVRAGEEKNIFPYNGEADAMFNSTLVYETSILKKYATDILKKVKADEQEYGEAQRILSFLEFFKEIEDDHYIPNNSIIREFIGGSIFIE